MKQNPQNFVDFQRCHLLLLPHLWTQFDYSPHRIISFHSIPLFQSFETCIQQEYFYHHMLIYIYIYIYKQIVSPEISEIINPSWVRSSIEHGISPIEFEFRPTRIKADQLLSLVLIYSYPLFLQKKSRNTNPSPPSPSRGNWLYDNLSYELDLVATNLVYQNAGFPVQELFALGITY